jgi:ubiquinone/menaquinone biosynthesis C-methylase UbiE
VKIVDKPMKKISFRTMSALFRMRDKFNSPRIKVEKADIKPGQVVLDYGCGPGSYTVEAAELAGDTGKVYAADIHPLSSKKVQGAASKKGLNNIETILINGATNATGLSEKCVDVVLSFDMFHMVSDRELLVKEWHRVLKSSGKLSLDCHHMEENDIFSHITDDGLFKLEEQRGKMYIFAKLAG